MDKIKINQMEPHFEIESIRQQAKNLLRIVFSSAIPETFGDITVYTSGGELCSNFPGYDTIYRDEGKTIYLSNDGSIYPSPADAGMPEGTLPPEPYIPTPEELLVAAQSLKRSEIASACEQIIYNGINVTLADGTVEHFRLTEHDQLNLFGKQVQIASGVEKIEYHADGQPCRYYRAEDMQTIIQAALFHVTYHTTYCNAVNMWITGCQDAAEVQGIFYGADVPEMYRTDVLNEYLSQIAANSQQ